jgi:hypothetical protein
MVAGKGHRNRQTTSRRDYTHSTPHIKRKKKKKLDIFTDKIR